MFYDPMDDMVTPEQFISDSLDKIFESIPQVREEMENYEAWRTQMDKLLRSLYDHKVSPEEVEALIFEAEGMPWRIMIALSDGLATGSCAGNVSWRYEVVMENGNKALKAFLQLNFPVGTVKNLNEKTVEEAALPLG